MAARQEDARQQARELLAGRALEPLAPVEEAELEALIYRFPELDDDGLELAAAALEEGALRAEQEIPLPAGLAARVEDDAQALFASEAGRPAAVPAAPRRPAPAARRASRVAVAGWTVAALSTAALAVFAFLFLARAGAPPDESTLAERRPPARAREALLEAQPDALRLAWGEGGDPSAEGAGGDVVWSDRAQRGFMRFRGLAPNDPQEAQYQLWIFDRTRDAAHPVDGGVFDIPPPSERREDREGVVVPIDARLPIGDAYQFAVTVERPGGVVVSDRERLALLAAASP